MKRERAYCARSDRQRQTLNDFDVNIHWLCIVSAISFGHATHYAGCNAARRTLLTYLALQYSSLALRLVHGVRLGFFRLRIDDDFDSGVFDLLLL